MSVFVVRQPVFNRYREVAAYELRFRSDDGAFAVGAAAGGASACFSSLTLDRLVNKKRMFVRFSAELLNPIIAEQLPRNLISVEIAENVGPVGEITQICLQLKEKGYMIIAGDFVLQPHYSQLIELMDFIKLDFAALSGEQRGAAIGRITLPRGKYLAVNVETIADFEQAVSLGCTYIQGRFFTQPQQAAGSDLNISRANYMRIFSELTQANLDFGRLEAVIQHDVAFCYKLLKFVNSAAFGFRDTIRSIRQALVLLGQKEVMHWVASLTLREAANNKPQELVAISVARAKLGELLAARAGLGGRAADIFLLGIFSLIDVLLDRPLPDVLNELPLAGDVKQALLGGKNPLRDFQEMIFAYEKGDWAEFARYAAIFRLPEEEVPELYCSAVQWADDFARM